MVQYVPAEGHLAWSPGEVAEVQTRRVEPHPITGELGDLVRADEGDPATDLDDDAGDGGIWLGAAPAGDDIDERADLGSGLVADGAPDDAGARNQGATAGPDRQQALR